MSRERINSSPEPNDRYAGQNDQHHRQGPGGGFHRPPRFRKRTMSVENTSLTEVITIYEKLRKPGEQDPATSTDVFKPSTAHFGSDIEESDFDETVPLEPFKGAEEEKSWGAGEIIASPLKVLDFSKYRNLGKVKYLYFSSATGLIESDVLDGLRFLNPSPNFEKLEKDLNYIQLLKSKHYWLNIYDPSEKDLQLLANAFSVHDLTLRDIRERNTDEKIEVYKHYMFISLKLLTENDTSSQRTPRNHNMNQTSHVVCVDAEESVFLEVGGGPRDKEPDTHSFASSSSEKDPMPPVEDVDFNILVFSDFIITIHDRHWGSIKDVLGFLNLLCTYGNSALTPDWVLFSVFIELAQDAKYSVNYLEPKILQIKVTETDSDYFSGKELSRVLKKNFEYEFEIYKILRFIKPKMNILRLLKVKCNKRLSSTVVKLLSNICSEFEELIDECNHFSHILERSQDTFLTMASVQQSLEANDMGKVMKRISEVALIFLPVQAIGGFLGMNVKVPFQDEVTTLPFWSIVLGSLFLAVLLFILRKCILNYTQNFSMRCSRCRCKRR